MQRRRRASARPSTGPRPGGRKAQRRSSMARDRPHPGRRRTGWPGSATRACQRPDPSSDGIRQRHGDPVAPHSLPTLRRRWRGRTCRSRRRAVTGRRRSRPVVGQRRKPASASASRSFPGLRQSAPADGAGEERTRERRGSRPAAVASTLGLRGRTVGYEYVALCGTDLGRLLAARPTLRGVAGGRHVGKSPGMSVRPARTPCLRGGWRRRSARQQRHRVERSVSVRRG
jgi:hypothetical protein